MRTWSNSPKKWFQTPKISVLLTKSKQHQTDSYIRAWETDWRLCCVTYFVLCILYMNTYCYNDVIYIVLYVYSIWTHTVIMMSSTLYCIFYETKLCIFVTYDDFFAWHSNTRHYCYLFMKDLLLSLTLIEHTFFHYM